MTKLVSYALDIGVYNIGGRGQILSSTTTGWARASEPISTIADLSYSGSCDRGAFADPCGHTWACGRSIGALADMIARDLDEGWRVALGFEAPMWFPVSRRESPALSVFGPRFDAERGSEWYLQSGAAATLKAISLGSMLLSELLARCPTRSFSTDTRAKDEQVVVLYEAFVVGPYKVRPPATVSGSAANEWDALTASLAWGALNAGFQLPSALRAVELHGRGSRQGDVISVWRVIADNLPDRRAIDGPSDCQVVALSVAEGQANIALHPTGAGAIVSAGG